MLKGGRPNKNLESFLKNDRKVLSFSIVWEDRSYDGGDKFYTLNFFLADNSIEVKEINQANTGRFPFPMLLKRLDIFSVSACNITSTFVLKQRHGKWRRRERKMDYANARHVWRLIVAYEYEVSIISVI